MPNSISALAPSLDDFVDGIWDLDVPDGEAARAMAVKVLPTASSILCVHYRAPILSDRRRSRRSRNGKEIRRLGRRPFAHDGHSAAS